MFFSWIDNRIIMAKKKSKIDWRVLCTGLICLTILECFAMSQGMNGWLLRLIVIVIAGTIGITIENPFKK